MKKIMVTVTTLVVVGFGSAFFSNSVQANTINNLHNKQAEIQNERSKIKENLSKAESEIADVLLDLQELNEEIVQVEEALKYNQSMLTKTEKEIDTLEEEVELLEEEIRELEESIETRYDMLKQRITSYQKTGGNIGFLDVLFGAESFGDFISRVSAVTKITNSDNDLIKQQEEDKDKVKKSQQKVEKKLDEQNDLIVELTGMKDLILDQKKQNKKSKKRLQKKEKELKTLKAELQTKDGSLASLEAQVRRDIAAARNPVQQTTNHSTSNSNNNQLTTLNSSKPIVGNGSISTAINAGKKFIGNTRYIWGSNSPANGGFDCSGFVSWSYGQAGYSLPSSTAGLSSVGKKVSYSNIQPGDLIFFNTYKTNGHVGIYLGGGKFIGSQSSDGVSIRSVSENYWKNRFTGHVRRVN